MRSLILLLLLSTQLIAQELLPVVTPTTTEVETSGDKISVQTVLIGIKSYKDVDGVLLISSDSEPAATKVAHLYLEKTYVGATVYADDQNRLPLQAKQINDQEWFIYGTGTIHVFATLVHEDTSRPEIKKFSITVGPAPPPPGPTPPPVPPPVPPNPSPFTEPGIRILIVYETNDVSTYSKEVTTILYSKAIRQWAVTSGAKDSKGHPELRILDKHTVVEDAKWSRLLKDAPTVPYLYIGNGTKGYSGPLPENEAAVLQLLETFK